MEVRVLGCHGGESPKHRTSSFLVEGRLAIDAGAITSMLALEEQRRIEVCLVSHAHMDHVRDLASLADNRCQQGGPTLTIASTRETIAALRAHFFNDRLWPDFSRIPAGEAGPTVSFLELTPERPVELAGTTVRAVLVDHTVETCGFVVGTGGGSVAYSGDTGPTERFWQVLADTPDLRGLLMEVSFPDHLHRLAKVSGHHTPETLGVELGKLGHARKDLPILLYHIKPVFERQVEKELLRIRGRELRICRLGERFLL
jgi:3',5'-cyclic-nucleotide phosphodiesterase